MKERLVGAAVLVAIGAWLIPWVLDGPERVMPPRSTALELPTPAAENPPIRTETIVLERGDAPVAHAPAPSEDVAGGAPEPVPAAPEPVATPAPVQNQPVAGAPGHAAAPTAAAGETQWYVQLGAFGDRANADRQVTRVVTYGYDAHVSDFPSSGRTVHRVRVGPEASRGRAEAIASALSAHGFVAQVVFE